MIIIESPEMQIAKRDVQRDEGCELKMYKDSKGIWTIGWGFNLEANEIPQEVADYLLHYMMEQALKDAQDFSGKGWELMNEARRAVIINLAYNLGRVKLFKMFTLKAALEHGNFDYAAARLQSFLWCKQVKTRCPRMCRQMRTGEVKK
jgi:lysozyme